MSSVEMSLLQSSGGSSTAGRIRVKDVVALTLLMILGICVSIWLVVAPPAEAPTRTSYLPAD